MMSHGRRIGRQNEDAFGVLLSGATHTAFSLDQETAKTRDRYGRGKWGQSVLLARRLIEAGVRMAFVNWPREQGDLSADNPLWDTHSKNNSRMKEVLCPQFDLGFTALIEDLDQRGLLDETLVVAIGEMGRTARFNAAAGRDHWGNVFSFVMAGAGLRGRQVYGESDRTDVSRPI
jgi:arylsulfatase A-like enzyme